MAAKERLIQPISTAELERRWAAVRGEMEARGIDVLVMQNSNEFLGGYVKWFTDTPAKNAYPHTIVFPRDDTMTMVCMGPMGGEKTVADDDYGNRGIGRILMNPSFSSVNFTSQYDARQVAGVIKERGDKTVGLVGTAGMYFDFCDTLKNNAGLGAKFVDATDLVDEIKAIKSEEERDRIRQTTAMQDTVVAELAKAIKPGMKDFEVTALAQYVGQLNGSEQGIFLGTSAPIGQPSAFAQRHNQGRELKDGDHLTVLVENNGAGGFYTEIARTFVLGKASAEILEGLENVVEAQKFCLDLLKPGTPCKDIFAAYNDYMQSRGLPRESRLHCHGQGYDLVERPLIRDDETMSIEQDMSIVCHPGYMTDKIFAVVCDNYLITENGASDCLHKTPQTVIEL